MGDGTADGESAVRNAAHRYEDALAAGDTAAATAFFDQDEATSRFGPEGPRYGFADLAALRSATPPQGVARWLYEEVRPIASDAILHIAVLQRAGATVQRTQVWRRRSAGWRIVHAHVSRMPSP